MALGQSLSLLSLTFLISKKRQKEGVRRLENKCRERIPVLITPRAIPSRENWEWGRQLLFSVLGCSVQGRKLWYSVSWFKTISYAIVAIHIAQTFFWHIKCS